MPCINNGARSCVVFGHCDCYYESNDSCCWCNESYIDIDAEDYDVSYYNH